MKSMRRTDDDIVLSGVDAYPIADDHAERAAQEQPEPKRVTLPQPIRWRQSLQAGWSGERLKERTLVMKRPSCIGACKNAGTAH